MGHYINTDWFRVDYGKYAGQYISSGVITRLAVSNGNLPTDTLGVLPANVRTYLVKNSRWMNVTAAKQFILLNANYRMVTGKNLKVNEGYRPLATQVEYYRTLGPAIAAKPGTSNHGFGLAADINAVTYNSPSDKWMTTYSQAYGWDRPQIFDRSGSERWHYNYIG